MPVGIPLEVGVSGRALPSLCMWGQWLVHGRRIAWFGRSAELVVLACRWRRGRNAGKGSTRCAWCAISGRVFCTGS